MVPTPGYPVNDGFSCIKGLSLDKQQTTVKPNSLPKIRQEDGSFKDVSWEEGFLHVADKLKELQEKYGKESVAGINGIRELRKLDKEAEIILISKDKEIYSRCILHHYLEGKRTIPELNFAETDFIEMYQVNWMKGKSCIGVNPEENMYSIKIKETKDSYKKIVHQNGKIVGAILQGDLAYGDILQQLIARRIDITKIKKPIFDVDYSDFFHVRDNFEYYYED